MKGKTYFFSMFTLVLLTGGLTGALKAPQMTHDIVSIIVGVLIVVGLIMIVLALSFTQGPQEH